MVRSQELVIGESWISGGARLEHLERWRDGTVHKEQISVTCGGGARSREKKCYKVKAKRIHTKHVK